jgi:hypothetical protein
VIPVSNFSCLSTFLRKNNIKTLNVAGSRGSKEPKVASFVKQALEEAFYRNGNNCGAGLNYLQEIP